MSEAEGGREGVSEGGMDKERVKEREEGREGGREGGMDKERVKEREGGREGSNTCYIEHMNMYTELKLLPFCLSLKKY